MTSARLIREHEQKNGLEAAHIIVLTGLTSASAKLEAWRSGVDDFLTKPVDFKQLENLMKAGKGAGGIGFGGRLE
jgi:DNA-binding response OmpR family regulator